MSGEEDGRESVEEIKNALGLRANDKDGMMSRLKSQGVNAKSLAVFSGAGDELKGGVAGATAPLSLSAAINKKPPAPSKDSSTTIMPLSPPVSADVLIASKGPSSTRLPPSRPAMSESVPTVASVAADKLLLLMSLS